MKRLVVIAGSMLLTFPVSAYALTPEQGQAIYDDVFGLIMTGWIVGFNIGLAIKIINRS